MTTHHQEDAMPTTIATTAKPPPYTPPAGDAARDPLRERALGELCRHDVEVRTVGLDLATVTLRVSDLDHVLSLQQDHDSVTAHRRHIKDLEAELESAEDEADDLRQDLAEAEATHQSELQERDAEIARLREALREVAGR